MRGPSYLVIAVGTWLLLSGHAIDQDWSRDVWIHAAAADSFADDLLHPTNPTLGTDDPHPLLTPYAAVVGVLARTTGAEPLTLFRFIGPMILAALLVALPAAARATTGRRDAAVPALLLLLLAWGITAPWRWSGLPNANALGFCLPLPSTAAFAGTVAAVPLMRRVAGRPTPSSTIALAAATAAIVLTHPATGLCFGAVLVGFLVDAGRRGRLAIVAALGGALVVAAAWPAYPFLRLFTEDPVDATNLLLLRDVPQRTVLLLPGVVAALARLRHHRSDPFAIACGVAAVGVAIGYAIDEPVGIRLTPAVALTGSIALGSAVARYVAGAARRSSTARWAPVVGVALLLAVGLRASLPGLGHAPPDALLPSSISERPELGRREVQRFDSLLATLPSDSVVATTDPVAIRAVQGYGPTIVGVAGLMVADGGPFADDIDQRNEATYRLVDPGTPPHTFDELVDRYGVTHLLVARGSLLRARIEVISEDDLYVVGAVG